MIQFTGAAEQDLNRIELSHPEDIKAILRSVDAILAILRSDPFH